MAVTVISRPLGHKLSTTDIDAGIIDTGGDALVYTTTAHGLVDGNYIYIESNFDAYNGFKYVDSISYDSFKIKESADGAYVPYKQDGAITFRISSLEHGWQCVHLPIVYELFSNLYPTNLIEDAYTNRIVSVVADVNGYTGLNLSSPLINVSELDYISLVGTGPLAGKYKIIDYLDSDDIVIDLAYDADNIFTGYEVVKHYNNYFITVNVYGGLSVSHPWCSEKPFELLATLKFIPDADGNVKFSISEILKGQINTRNNLTLDTLPNNLDFFTSFYITYQENYDTSDGVNVTTFTGTESVDSINFIGYATNSMMPFKSLNMGHMSEYVNCDDCLAKWLITQDRPVAVIDRFVDFSFINQYDENNISVVIQKSIDGVTTDTETLELSNPGRGILRIPVTPQSGFDQYCIQAHTDEIAGFTPAILPELTAWSNIASGTSSWALAGGVPESNTSGLGFAITSDKWATAYSFVAGKEYMFSYTFTVVGSTGLPIVWSIVFMDSSDNVLDTITLPSTMVTITGVITVLAESGYAKIGVLFYQAGSCTSIPGACIKTISSFENETESEPSTPSQAITEQLCIDIVEECSGTFINDNLRITEGGQFRELE